MVFRDMFKKTTYIRVELSKEEQKKIKKARNNAISAEEKEPTIPEGMWTKCDHCGDMIYIQKI